MDVVIILFILFIALIAIYTYNTNKYGSQRSTLVSEKDVESNESSPNTRNLVFETLNMLNIDYEVDSDQDDRIVFTYQGETFVVDAANDCYYINIWDLWWGHCELYDIDGFARIKKAMNESNIHSNITTLYSINEGENTIGIHCRRNILFKKNIKNRDQYLSSELASFFQTQRYIAKQIDKYKNEEEKVNSR